MGHAIPLWTPPALPVDGSSDSFPVRRIFCVGRNYAEHQKEMGGDGREQPFFFIKSAHSLVPRGGNAHYPPKTANYHYETELVVALGKGGRRIDAKRATDHIFGYAVGLDMTRRDLQRGMGDQKKPWEIGKSFDNSAPIGPIHPVAQVGHFKAGLIQLKVNGQVKQSSDLKTMIWDVAEQISQLSQAFELKPGDIIYSGTPENVGPVVAGDVMEGSIAGLPAISVKVT
jgi:fumarylpyruvate hydrolase